MSLKEFNEVIGYEDVKIELERIIDMMKNPKNYSDLGVTTTKGLLLHGEPGVGKTLLSKCFIKASKRPVFTIRKDLPDGDFIKFIKNSFEEAKLKEPSIVFLDDMDKFANGDRDHRNAEEFVTIQSCIDGCKDYEVFVIATTNDLDAVPDSLLRVGRFDKTIVVENPTGEDAAKIIKHYLQGKKCSKDVDYKQIAKLLDGRSCAALETVINEAGVYAGYEKRKEISMDDLVRSIMRIVYKSPEKINPKSSKEVLDQIAYHEAGHALVGEILEPGSVNLVTIKEHDGNIGGFTSYTNNDDYFANKKYMENRVMSLLAGKAANEIVFGTTDVGSYYDLTQAFHVVKRFVLEYCEYGFNTYSDFSHRGFEELKDNETRLISYEIERYYQETRKILIQNRDKLDKLAKLLLKNKTLIESQVQAVLVSE